MHRRELMANRVTYRARPDLQDIQMNNGGTAVFVGVLSLAASALAASARERQFAAWVSSHDQDLFGLGTVGFDVSEPDHRFDPAVVAPMTNAEIAEEGWPG